MNTIREIRKQKNMTQAELADKIGVKRTVLGRYENGIITPPLPRLKAIAEELGVSIECLLIDTNAPQKHRNNKMIKKSAMHNQIQLVLFYSQGVCELCGNNAPFKDLNGFPYLKVKTLQDDLGNPEDKFSVKNLVALCPNCYDKLLVRKDAEDINYLTNVASKHDF